MEKEYYWKEWSAHAAAPNTHNRVMEMISGRFPVPEGMRVLDVPCGAGAFSRSLAELGFTVNSVDIHPFDDFQHDPLRLTVADVNAGLPFPAASFDIVVSIEGIEHMENPSFFLRECARVLADDGLLLLTTPNVDSFRSRRKYFQDGFNTFFNPEDSKTRTSGHLHPIDMVFFRGASARAGLHIEEIAVNRIVDTPVARFLKNLLRTLLTRKLPETMQGEIPFFGDVVIYALRKMKT